MKLPRRQFLHLAGGAAALPAVSRFAWAQAVPPSKTGTRFITLGTRGGPNPTVWRAQTSNALIVNGVPYIVRPLGVLNRWGMQNRRRLLKRFSFRFIERRIITNGADVLTKIGQS
jgi:hypothetical protein